MAVVKHKISQALAEVSDEEVETLVESGQWEKAAAPKPAPHRRTPAPKEG